MRKLVLKGPFSPDHVDNRMASEGMVSEARDIFLKTRFPNLDILLKARYAWMNEYLQPNAVIVEVGAGAGFSPLYLSQKPILTDNVTTPPPWIDEVIDATGMHYEDNSVDVIIAAHNIHHFPSPYKFFDECKRVLKDDGFILIQEINTSLMMRFLLKVMRHEGWSYDVDVFNPDEIVTDKNDLWSANCAIPEMLFHNQSRFEQVFTSFKVKRNQLCECLIFPLSGGVIAKTKVPKLPIIFLNFVLLIDKILVSLLPNVFALGRSVVLQKV